MIGLGVQCFVERKELKESYEQLKTRAGQVKTGTQKVHACLQEKKRKGQENE